MLILTFIFGLKWVIVLYDTSISITSLLHRGRGVWRCLYDPNSSLLVTAGFDSAIKIHQLHASLSKGLARCKEVVEESIHRNNLFTLRLPYSSEHNGLMDSKSEYVRCMHFTHEGTLYVATNNGFLYHAKISDAGDVQWTELFCVSEKVPIICMDFLSESSSDPSIRSENWIALGDGKGKLTVVIVGDIWTPKVEFTFSWSAEAERQLLGTFWCKSLGHRYIFTVDPRGSLKLWRLSDPSQSVLRISMISSGVSLVAEYISCFPTRILCLDASLQEEERYIFGSLSLDNPGYVLFEITGSPCLFTLRVKKLKSTVKETITFSSVVSYICLKKMKLSLKA